MVELVGGGSVINGATLSSFFSSLLYLMVSPILYEKEGSNVNNLYCLKTKIYGFYPNSNHRHQVGRLLSTAIFLSLTVLLAMERISNV